MTTNNGKLPAIVFDFGNVIFDWNPYNLFGKFFVDRQAIEAFMLEVDFKFWNLLLDMGHPFQEVLAEQTRLFPQYAHIFRAYDEDWQATFGGAIQPTVDILTTLHGSGHSLYALSNWSAEKFAVVRPQYPFLEWFEDIVLSGDLRMAKPDPLIFMAFLQRTGLNAPDCLFIDDSAANIQVSSQMGFGTILFQSPAQLKDDLQNRGLLN